MKGSGRTTGVLRFSQHAQTHRHAVEEARERILGRACAIAEEPIENLEARRVYARAILTQREGRNYAALTGPQGSGILTSMALANALAIVPEDVPMVAAGDEVDAILLD